MRIYLHCDETHDPEAIEIDATSIIGEALDVDGSVVLLEDAEEILDPAQTFEEAGVADRAHVFHGPRAKIVAAVRYNGPTITREYTASTRVEQVFRWAVGNQGFNLSQADAADHTLQLPDGTVPPADAHLGSITGATAGRVDFDLVPKHRFEG